MKAKETKSNERRNRINNLLNKVVIDEFTVLETIYGSYFTISLLIFFSSGESTAIICILALVNLCNSVRVLVNYDERKSKKGKDNEGK